jgi:hypothetical protein
MTTSLTISSYKSVVCVIFRRFYLKYAAGTYGRHLDFRDAPKTGGLIPRKPLRPTMLGAFGVGRHVCIPSARAPCFFCSPYSPSAGRWAVSLALSRCLDEIRPCNRRLIAGDLQRARVARSRAELNNSPACYITQACVELRGHVALFNTSGFINTCVVLRIGRACAVDSC